MKNYYNDSKVNKKYSFYLSLLSVVLLLSVLLFANRALLARIGILSVSASNKIEITRKNDFAPLEDELSSKRAETRQADEDIVNTPPLQREALEELKEYRNSREARLFFTKFNDIGQLNLVSIIRTIKFNSSPLTRTIVNLLSGPDLVDINNGLYSMIPESTELLSASIEDSVAVLNFNESFIENVNVYDVRWAQLEQLVFTTTEFSNVSSVKVLINGQSVPLWGEIDLDRSYARDDFLKKLPPKS